MVFAAQPDVPVDEGLLEACGETPTFFCEAAWDASQNQLVARGADWFVTRPIVAILILIVAALVNRWLRKLITATIVKVAARERLANSAFERVGLDAPNVLAPLTTTDPRTEQRGETLAVVARAVVSVVVWSVAMLMILGVFNINLGPLLAGAGIAGIALGLGAQSLVRDCISGFFIILEDQYAIGDEVDLGEAAGVVETITLRATTLRAPDGTMWSVPNGAIVRVGNQSKLWSRALLDVTVWYESDVDKAVALMTKVSAEVCALPEFADVVLDEPTVLGVQRMGPDGVVLRVVVRTAPGAQWTLMRALRLALKAAFEESGVLMHRPTPPIP